MTLDDVLQALRDRDAALVVRDGSLRYVGVSPLAPDDPLRVAIQAHRSALITVLSAPQPDGSPDRLDSPECHQERAHIDDPARVADTGAPTPSAAPSTHRSVNPGMLMTVGHYHGYARLSLKPVVSIAEGYTAWRTFTRTANADMLALAAEAARAIWSDDPMTNDLYYVPPIDPDAVDTCRNENGACQESTHEHFDFDDFFDDYRAAQEDGHFQQGESRGLA